MKNDDALAKQEIFELSCRYMRSLDRLDAELRHTVFHDDATVDYGFFKGSAREFVDFAQNALKDHLANHHMLGQALIDEFLGNLDAASATRGRAARLLQLGDILNAVVYGFMNLLVGDGFAKTDVHGIWCLLRYERG